MQSLDNLAMFHNCLSWGSIDIRGLGGNRKSTSSCAFGQQFAQEFGLCVTNAKNPETDTDWTFDSNMGIRRRLDFVLASNLLLVLEYRMDEDDISGVDTDSFALEALLTF